MKKRLVVKLGTQVVVDPTLGAIRRESLSVLMSDIAHQRELGHEVILVSSGAVGLGQSTLELSRPLNLPTKQACAAVGQSQLMGEYAELAKNHGILTAQILVTAHDFTNRISYLNLRNTCERLLALQVLPIFNENDVVSIAGIAPNESGGERTEQKSFDDNDSLSALVAGKLSATELVILTNVDGVYTENPATNREAKRIEKISSLQDLNNIHCSGTSTLGRGGMHSKLQAAKTAALCGVRTIISSANSAAPLSAALSGVAGTLIDIQESVSRKTFRGKERWFGLSSGFAGIIHIDQRARRALEESRCSLLPVGIVSIDGEFDVDDIVSVVDEQGEEVGRGITSQSSETLRKTAGKRSSETRPLLLKDEKEEAIHRDNLVIFREGKHELGPESIE